MTLPTVTRVQTGSGSHIEPAFDESWPSLEKLRWQAAVVLVDSPRPFWLDVTPANVSRRAKRPFGRERWVSVDGMFSIQIENASHSAFSFGNARTFLNGVSAGARAMKDA